MPTSGIDLLDGENTQDKRKVIIDPGQGAGTLAELQGSAEGRKLLSNSNYLVTSKSGLDLLEEPTTKGKVDIVAKKSGNSSNDFYSDAPIFSSIMGSMGYGPKPEGGYSESGLPLNKEGKSFAKPDDPGILGQTVGLATTMATHPADTLKGVVDLALSIPGFATGVGIASIMTGKALIDQIAIANKVDLDSLYNTASKGMEYGAEFFEPGKKLLVGEPTPESQIPGQIAMSIPNAISAVGQKVAAYEGFKDSPNIRGAAKFVADVTGLLVLGRISHGGSKIPKRVEGIVKDAADVAKKESELASIVDPVAKAEATAKVAERKAVIEEDAKGLADHVSESVVFNEAIEKAKGKITEVEKAQAELELKANQLKQDKLEAAREKLREQGKNVDEVKQRLIEEGEGFVPERSAMDLIEPKEVIRDEVSKEVQTETKDVSAPPKEDVTFIGMQERLRGDPLPLVNETSGSTVVYKPEKHNIVNIDKYNEAIKPKEPITDLDLQTGTPLPDALTTDKSLFRQTPEHTKEMTKMFEHRARSVEGDIELITSKLLNDVNRWLDGDESIPINDVRNTLSEFAVRADELKGQFAQGRFFDSWKRTVSEAAQWARSADRLINKPSGPKLYTGLDPELLKPFYSKLKEVVGNVKFNKSTYDDLVRMLKGRRVTADEVSAVLGGLKDRKGSISKEEILGEVKANETKFEDVVLGGSEQKVSQEVLDKAYYEYSNALSNNKPSNIVNELYDKWDRLRKGTPNTKYDTYVEPGAKEGSYRELFVTAPSATKQQSYQDWVKGGMKETWSTEGHTNKWSDGHPPYSSIQNPVVRIRYNEREVNGKRILFIEEMQGPSKENQSLMPSYLRDRIYDIGVKRVIALAKEEGFDGVSWTTGEMQAGRYDLSKQISRIEYNDNSSGGIGQANILGEPSYGTLKAYDLNSKNVIEQYIHDPLTELSGYIGKEAAQKLLMQKPIQTRDAGIGVRRRMIEGIDLKVGGEGLKRLYDDQLPGLMKKYGKENVRDINIETGQFDSYRYEGPKVTIEDVSKVIRDPREYSASLISAAMEVKHAMINGLSDNDAMAKGTPALANLFGGEIYDVTKKINTPYIPIHEKTPSHFTMYSGLPIDEVGKAIVDGAKRLSEYTKKARGMKSFKPAQAAQMIKEEFNRAFVDRSGNIRKDLLDHLGEEGYRIVQKMYLSKGASSLSASMMKQMQKEVYGGLNRNEKRVLDNLILANRMLDIGRYKTPEQFKFPDGLKPVESAAYNELFQFIEKLDDVTAAKLKQKAASYYEWMKKPLKDMLDGDLITQEEYNDLVSHNYRRLKLVDVYDKRYEAKVGDKKRTVYDSGVQALSHGRDTDIFEPSSEIMALEVFNRAYGRILNNEANKSLLELARSDKENPFVRVKESKEDRIPTGWNRIFAYEKGERKSIYLSPTMSKEWITNSPEMSYKMGQVLRYASGSPVLRTMATGIDWGFALANLPRDIMHIWYAARTFENGQWKSLYNTNMPVYVGQMGHDLTSVFSDAMLRKGRYEDYIKEGGGMEFLVHQGRLLQRGRHLEGNIDKMFDFMGYFGETSEILTRLAIRERTLRKGKSNQEATFVARDYMDFGQGGGIAKAADNALPYLNASIQGTRGMFRAFKDSPLESSYKLAQFAALVTGIYIASNKASPETMKSLHGNIDMQNNLVIPLGDWSSYEDEKGQTRYVYFKIPLDPGQRFFKTFFEASTDKWLGNEVDVNAVTNSLTQVSPVGTSSLPPTLSGALGYVTNKDFWLNEDIWRKTDKPFSWPKSKEEYIPGQTPQAFVDLGKVTGLSPERSKKAIEQLVTGGSMWSYLAGAGYEGMFSDLPKDQREKHLAEVISKIPVIKRFIGVTNPYSQFASIIDQEKEVASLKRWSENRGLDTLVDGYLYKDNVTRSEIADYMRSFKDKDTYDRLKERFEFSQKIRELPNRSFWLSLKGISDTRARAKVYVDRYDKADEVTQSQIMQEMEIVKNAGGVISDEFKKEVMKVRSGN